MGRALLIKGDLAFVPLTKGYVAVIDAVDVPKVEGYNWTALVKRKTVYAKRAEKVDGRHVTIRMHRVIANAPNGALVDHWDEDGLNNRRDNLRVSTNSQNLCNRGAQANNTSGFKGVTWNKNAKKWMAQIKIHGQRHYLGLFETPEDAHAAYGLAAREMHGEFARLS